MSEHRAVIAWTRSTQSFRYEDYDRDHTWRFPGGVTVAASAAPEYLGDASRVDPEQAFTASIASCHMLTFLSLAARRRYSVDAYEDEAVATLDKNERGRLAITEIVLRPRIAWGGSSRPGADEVSRLHQLSHQHCFIANSVATAIRVEPRD